ncbi:hypothetical protein ACFX16_013067 [Malus domestica]
MVHLHQTHLFKWGAVWAPPSPETTTKRSIKENRTGNQQAPSQLDIATINIVDSSRGLNQIDSEERALE